VSRPLPNLARTAAALAAYDARWGDAFDPLQACPLAEAVGAAYGADTARFNNPETCRALVRPGPRTPGPGSAPTFVRRMVARWRAETELA
jgi:hypothetical protein